eukprot:349604-Chlamydomonas_euryale.AAC.4
MLTIGAGQETACHCLPKCCVGRAALCEDAQLRIVWSGGCASMQSGQAVVVQQHMLRSSSLGAGSGACDLDKYMPDTAIWQVAVVKNVSRTVFRVTTQQTTARQSAARQKWAGSRWLPAMTALLRQ